MSHKTSGVGTRCFLCVNTKIRGKEDGINSHRWIIIYKKITFDIELRCSKLSKYKEFTIKSLTHTKWNC